MQQGRSLNISLGLSWAQLVIARGDVLGPWVGVLDFENSIRQTPT